MQVVSNRLLSHALSFSPGAIMEERGAGCGSGVVQRLINYVLQVLASCLPMLHGRAIGAQLPGPGTLARAGQARPCAARARHSCHPPCSASRRRSAAALACTCTATRATTALSQAAACPLLVRPQLLTVSGTYTDPSLHQHCTTSWRGVIMSHLWHWCRTVSYPEAQLTAVGVCAGAPESPMSAFEVPASLLGRLSSGAEQPSLAGMASPTPEQALGLPGNLSPAVPSPGSLFFATPGSLPAPLLWSPATQHSTADSQHAGVPYNALLRGVRTYGFYCEVTLHSLY